MENERFREVCELVQKAFGKSFDENVAREDFLELQKKAILGRKREIEYFEDKIEGILSELKLENESFPCWYKSLPSAIFHEIWGMAGLAEWLGEEYEDSTSAKIIGQRIYFLVKGKMKLMPQRISDKRRDQLIRALLLANPRQRAGENHYEIYMSDGTRVTVFRNELVKSSEDVIIFRRYVIKDYRLSELCKMKMLPEGFETFAEKLIKEGANVAFVGELRSGKTTLLTAWQSLEKPELEGVLVETDPEIPIDKIMPTAPIVQLIADGEKMENVVKDLMRSDADYFIFGEARDAVTLNTAIRIAERGGKRVKMTYHITNPFQFPQAVGTEIAMKYGGNVVFHEIRAARAFQYLFHLTSEDDGGKRLQGIYKIEVDYQERSYSVIRGWVKADGEFYEEESVKYDGLCG